MLACLVGAAALGAVVAVAALWGDRLGTETWPSSAAERFQATLIALAFVVGLVAMLRLVVSLLQPDAGPTAQQVELLLAEARTDTLTGLGNRRAFNDDLAAEVERRNRTGSVFSLMAIDLDGLKDINDLHGHQAGDAHLRASADRLAAVIGARGTVYRTGGDEFMVLLPGSRNLHAIELAHAIHRSTAGIQGGRALSIGVTETTGTEHRQQLVRQADLALYEAKREKLPVVPYQPALEGGEAASGIAALSPRRNAVATALARTVAVRDAATGEHSGIVAELAVAVGVRLGLAGRRLEQLRIAALLHDVGKIAVSDAILHKHEPLTREERLALREHVPVGRDLLAAAGLVEEARWVLHHHERFDGSGYPGTLSGSAIPLEARVIAVADAYEAQTATRPYGQRLTPDEALAELTKEAGRQFDPACVAALVAVVQSGPIRRAAPVRVTV